MIPELMKNSLATEASISIGEIVCAGIVTPGPESIFRGNDNRLYAQKVGDDLYQSNLTYALIRYAGFNNDTIILGITIKDEENENLLFLPNQSIDLKVRAYNPLRPDNFCSSDQKPAYIPLRIIGLSGLDKDLVFKYHRVKDFGIPTKEI